jgi:hypothetical protein
MNTITCEYCNKEIYKSNKKRHYNTKECRNKQQNKDIKLELKEHKCKYCDKIFNRVDTKNEHQPSCNSMDIYYKLTNIINETKMELKIKNDEITFLKSQLQTEMPRINSNETININNNKTININFDDIKKHLDEFNIYILSDYTELIRYIMNIFSGKLKLTNESKQTVSYYIKDKSINDIKCKTFLSNSARRLVEISDKICKEGKDNKSLSDTIVKSACENYEVLNDISSEEGVKKGIRKNKPMILVNEIIRCMRVSILKEN